MDLYEVCVKNKLTLFIISSLLVCITVNAKSGPLPPIASAPPPWFTGPLLAPAGHTIPAGHQNYEPYLFWTDNIGIYNSRWQPTHTSQSHTVSPTMVFTQGVTSFMDVQIVIPYDFNSKQRHYSSNIGDTSLIVGFQVLNDKPRTIIPDLRVTLQEAFPTGRYENLNPAKLGVDATGSGSYQTGIGLNFQKLISFCGRHFLRLRLSIVYTIPANTSVRNFNSYGGGFGTNGTAHPSNLFSTDLAFEYTLTEHWVLAMDALFTSHDNATFTGSPGFTNLGTIAMIGRPSREEYSLAPAIEYNFNAHVGIIAGTWFSLTGRNARDFQSVVVAINYYH